MKNKKSGFWNFILSWIPGCSEMYMGFMKMGLSLMAVFWGIILASIVLNLGPLMFLAMIAWFYSFFHARNMYHMDDELFRVTEDRYLFDVDSLTASSEKIAKRYRKIIAIVLVFRGLYSAVEFVLPEIVKAIYRRAAYYLPQVIVGIGIIAIGKVMLDGKKKELYGDDAEDRKQDGGVMQDGSEENNGTERNE